MKRHAIVTLLSLSLSAFLLLSSAAAEENKKVSPVEKLVRAIGEGDAQEVQDLLKNTSSVNVQIETKGYGVITPIFEAIYARDAQICKVLIEQGADINFVAPFFGTPLHYAVYHGAEDIVALLLENKVDINKRIEVGLLGIGGHRPEVTPLLLAVIRGKEEMVALLLNKGADVTVKTPQSWKCPDGCSLIELARTGRRSDLITLLKKYGAPE